MPPLPRTAVIASHGQPSAPPPAEIHLASIAAKVADNLPGWDVRSATLSSKGFLEKAMVENAVVFPFFMARGWFTGKVLPQRLEGFRFRMTAPFGLLTGLPEATARELERVAQERNETLDASQILLAAHGSARGPMAAEAAEQFAERLRSFLPQCDIHTGFIEEAPYVVDAARGLEKKAFCLPFFAQSGEHVREDIPAALEKAGFEGTLLPSLGAMSTAPALIAKAIVEAQKTDLPTTAAENHPR